MYACRRLENADKPKIPKRLKGPLAPPPRPPPRSKDGGLKSAFMGLIGRDSGDKPEDEKELQNSLQKSPYDTDDPALIEVEVLPQGDPKRNVYPVPEENEATSLDGRGYYHFWKFLDFDKYKKQTMFKITLVNWCIRFLKHK